jgi:hypothetical protein
MDEEFRKGLQLLAFKAISFIDSGRPTIAIIWKCLTISYAIYALNIEGF